MNSLDAMTGRETGSVVPTGGSLAAVKAELFKALAHPARVRILEILTGGEHTVGAMQPLVGIEASHLSQQLAVLRRAGLVATRKEGTSVVYATSDPRIGDLLAVARRLLLSRLRANEELIEELAAEVADR